jgi:antitoxin (DNA-binding transcriptional repressor) of toxin-antitoxin stability system
LLGRVASGHKITITRHGVPAAMLVPISEDRAKLSHAEVVKGTHALRGRVKPGKFWVGWSLMLPELATRTGSPLATLNRKLRVNLTWPA